VTAPALQQLGSEVWVAGQLDPAAMAWAAQAGFKSVINNRPDFEGGPDQATSAAMQRAAEAAGLTYAFLPVHPAVQTPQEVACFADLLARLPKPILVFCRSGARSGKLYRIATGA
jgi:uncharacterized protein (TIGR01244 family)